MKDVWKNEGFQSFFYDIHTINYFSPKSLKKLYKKLQLRQSSKYSLRTVQGYSIINHIAWFLNNKPTTTNRTGGDYFIERINQILSGDNEMSVLFKHMLTDLDSDYKKIIQNKEYGNQIEFIIEY